MPDFKPDKPKHVFQLTFEGDWPTSVAFLGSHRKLAAGNRAGHLYIWDLPENSDEAADNAEKKEKTDAPSGPPPSRRLDGHTNGITRLQTTPDGKTLISASLDGTVRLWDHAAPATGKAEAILDIKTREREAKRERNDELLTAPGVEVETVSADAVLEGHADWVHGLGIDADGKRLITGDDRANAIVWDLPARKELVRWQGYPGNWVSSAALSPDGGTAFVAEYCSRRGDFDRPPAQARFYDAATGEEKLDVLKVQFPKVKKRDNSYGYASTWGKFVARGFVCSAFSPDGKLLAVGQGGETGTGEVHLIDTESGNMVRSVSGHQYGVTDVMFSADGKYVLSCGRDTTVRICQTADGKEVNKLGTPRGGQFKDWLYALSLSPDERWLAAADISGIVHVWRFEG